MNPQGPLQCVANFGQDDYEVEILTEVDATRDYQIYNVTVTARAFVTIFFLVTRTLIRGLGTYLVPLMLRRVGYSIPLIE
jgi:heme/copper-type cytochrome/quinol oxidase subunit 1